MSYGDDMKDYQHDLEIQENYRQYMQNKKKYQDMNHYDCSDGIETN